MRGRQHCWFDRIPQNFFHGHDVGEDAAEFCLFAVALPLARVVLDDVIGVVAVQFDLEAVHLHACVAPVAYCLAFKILLTAESMMQILSWL